MRFKVYLLRRRGRRLSWRDAQNGPTYVGRLVTHIERHGDEQYKVTRLQPDDPMAAERMPELYEAMLLGFAPVAFRLRGFERVDGPDGGYSVVQEWHAVGVQQGSHLLLRDKCMSPWEGLATPDVETKIDCRKPRRVPEVFGTIR